MKITLNDFIRLSHTSMAWNEYGRDWKDQIKDDRFEPMPRSIDWKTAYWFDTYSACLLAKLFLDDMAYKYELFSDEWSGDWVIVTDLNV
jgi:hypothetical protein